MKSVHSKTYFMFNFLFINVDLCELSGRSEGGFVTEEDAGIGEMEADVMETPQGSRRLVKDDLKKPTCVFIY